MNQQTLDFIQTNLDNDVRTLALKGAPENVDLNFALDQIAGWQKAKVKLPSWAGIQGMVYPPHLSMEQCSSEETACYKTHLVQRLLKEKDCGHDTLVDLTGGFGVDFSFMAQGFQSAVYVERQENLCDIARHNFSRLGLSQASVVCGDSVDYLKLMSTPVSVIFVDPARRNATGGRTFAIADCTPDVAALCQELKSKAHIVMIKLSPMLDWRKAVADMGSGVGEVHIVSAGGECKELLLVLSSAYNGLERLYCVNGSDVFVCDMSDSLSPVDSAPVDIDSLLQGDVFVYEPNASVMKAGCFRQIEAAFGIRQIDSNSHLFFAHSAIRSFPGRSFVVEGVTTMNKKELRKALSGIGKANITVRNFPMNVADLRKRLKISEGGSTYIFATTLTDKTHVLLICKKQSS